jgi:DNA-binding transcriptional regulator YiaG
MDHGIEAKQLQDILHADENSINGWECRGVYPSGDYLRRVVEFIDANQTEPIPRKTIWALCFANNPAYPKRPKTLGDRLRATRMENFMSIKELARKFDVNECTVAKWELGKSKPRPDMLERVNTFLKATE